MRWTVGLTWTGGQQLPPGDVPVHWRRDAFVGMPVEWRWSSWESGSIHWDPFASAAAVPDWTEDGRSTAAADGVGASADAAFHPLLAVCSWTVQDVLGSDAGDDVPVTVA